MRQRSKNKKIPLKYRLLPLVFPIAEKVSTAYAKKLAVKMFFTPPKSDLNEEEVDFIKKAKRLHFYVKAKNVYAYSWGSGQKKILLVHGWGGKSSQFMSIILNLVKLGYEVVAFDAPGHGLSDGNDSDILLFEKAIQEINSILGEFECIIGHSLGAVASLLAQKNGLKAKRIITISAPSIAEDILYLFRKNINASEAITKHIEDHIENKYGLPFYHLSGETIAEQLTCKTPTLLIHDKDDKQVPIKHLNALKDKLPHAEHFYSEGYGHNHILENVYVHSKIEKFLHN